MGPGVPGLALLVLPHHLHLLLQPVVGHHGLQGPVVLDNPLGPVHLDEDDDDNDDNDNDDDNEY